jgi:hypothetical protein
MDGATYAVRCDKVLPLSAFSAKDPDFVNAELT